MLIQFLAGEGRAIRVFIGSGVPLTDEQSESAVRVAHDDEDQAQIELLRGILRQPVIDAEVYWYEERCSEGNACAVFMKGDTCTVAPGQADDYAVFACAVFSAPELDRMMHDDRTEIMVEAYTQQFSPCQILTEVEIRDGLEAWAARNFRDIPAPRFNVRILENLSAIETVARELSRLGAQEPARTDEGFQMPSPPRPN